jgi:DNA-binding NtrC family response regulator
VLRAIIVNSGGELMPEDFPELRSGAHARTDNAFGVSPWTATHAGVADQGQMLDQGIAAPGARADRPLFARYGVTRLLDERGEMRPIGALEEEVIRFAIGHYRGRMSEVARRLGIGRSTLYRKIKDYGIAAGEPVAS